MVSWSESSACIEVVSSESPLSPDSSASLALFPSSSVLTKIYKSQCLTYQFRNNQQIEK